MFYLLVAGSRTFNNKEVMFKKLDYFLQNQPEVTIVEGGARGADTLAKEYAQAHNFKCVEIPAEWNVYGKSAGYKRNEKMHQYISHYKNRGCICFWDGQSKGTQHNFELAKRYNTRLVIVKGVD